MHEFYYSVPSFITCVRGMRIIITPNIVSEVLHVPRVVHPNYPSCNHLKTVFKKKLSSLFCETPSPWGERQNTPCSSFTKGPRFLNMVMTFVLHPLSHYNSVTEPLARFLLSLLERLTIDFPSHFILSLIDVYKDTRPVISSFFLQLSHGFFAFLISPIPSLLIFQSYVPYTLLLFDRVRPSFDRSGCRPR